MFKKIIARKEKLINYFFNNKKAFVVIFVILFLCAACFFAKKFNFKAEKDNPQKVFNKKDPKLDKFFLKGIENKITVWELTGEYALLNFESDKNKIKIISPKIYFYDKEQQKKTISAWVNAKNAIVNTFTKDMQAFGDVVMFSETQNVEIKTQEVFYDYEKNIFYSDKFVSIAQDKNITEGVGFEAKSDLSEINIKKNIVIKYFA